MMTLLQNLLISLAFLTTLSRQEEPSQAKKAGDDFEVIKIVELFRHGARTPVANLFKEKYIESFGEGKLTGNGERQHFVLGSYVRDAYPQLFMNSGKPITTNQITILSSQMQRTIRSAQSHMMGLVPFGQGPNVTADSDDALLPDYKHAEQSFKNSSALPFAYKPIPIISANKTTDTVFFPENLLQFLCPDKFAIYNQIFEDYEKENVQKFNSTFEKLKMEGYTPKDIFNKSSFSMQEFGLIADNFIAYRNFFGKLPDKISQELYDEVFRAYNVVFNFWVVRNDVFGKVFTTDMASSILEQLEEKVEQVEVKEIYIGYSGHDTNLVPFMSKFKMYSNECLWELYQNNGKTDKKPCYTYPTFASNFMFELSKGKSTKEHYVRVLYNNKQIDICPDLEGIVTDGENAYCPFSKFSDWFSKEFIMGEDEFVHFCGDRSNDEDNVSFSRKGYWITIGIISVLVFILLIILTRFQMLINKTRKAAKIRIQDHMLEQEILSQLEGKKKEQGLKEKFGSLLGE